MCNFATLCFVEFHQQLESAVCVLELVPGVVFGEVREEYQMLLDKERMTRTEKYESSMRELRNTKVCFNIRVYMQAHTHITAFPLFHQ